MKKNITIFLASLLLVSLLSPVTMAKPKKKFNKNPRRKSNYSIHNNEYLTSVFNISRYNLDQLKKFNFTDKELSLVLYLHSISEKEISNLELNFINNNKSHWDRITWTFGVPPIIFENGFKSFKHPQIKRLSPPANNRKKKEWVKERIEESYNKYKYNYEDKRLKIKESVEITANKYEYSYNNRCLGIKEKLEIHYPSYRYEYSYKDRRTRENIKRRGWGKSLKPVTFYQLIKEKKKEEKNFNFSVKININL